MAKTNNMPKVCKIMLRRLPLSFIWSYLKSCIRPHKPFCLSQDSVQPVIIKEEGLEAFAEQVSPDSGPYTDHVGLYDDDPDYQVDFMDT